MELAEYNIFGLDQKRQDENQGCTWKTAIN